MRQGLERSSRKWCLQLFSWQGSLCLDFSPPPSVQSLGFYLSVSLTQQKPLSDRNFSLSAVGISFACQEEAASDAWKKRGLRLNVPWLTWGGFSRALSVQWSWMPRDSRAFFHLSLCHSPSVHRCHPFLRNWIFLIFLVRRRNVEGIQMSSSRLAYLNHAFTSPVITSLGPCLLLCTTLTPMAALCICEECGTGTSELQLLVRLFLPLTHPRERWHSLCDNI